MEKFKQDIPFSNVSRSKGMSVHIMAWLKDADIFPPAYAWAIRKELSLLHWKGSLGQILDDFLSHDENAHEDLDFILKAMRSHSGI